jgi:hypothetical protein
MQSPIKRIVQFNHDADLVKSGYSDFLESSFQIEEALEGFYLDDVLPILENSHPNYSQTPNYGPVTAKDVSRGIVNHCINPISGTVVASLSDVERLDKACDAVVFAIGSMTKLGLNAQQITQALNIVMDSNQAKLKCRTDSAGKLQKPENFVGPEPRLQELLDSRS